MARLLLPCVLMLLAIAIHEDQAWMFWVIAPAKKLAAQKDRFEAFIESLRFPAGGSAKGERTGPVSTLEL